MRRLLVLAALCLACFATSASAAVNLGLPGGTPVNFLGSGVFDQSIPFTFDDKGPLPMATGSELFGVGTIANIAPLDDPGNALVEPDEAGVEMTFVFWDAVVRDSDRSFLGEGTSSVAIVTKYTDARMLIVTDTTPDFTAKSGPQAFNLTTGEFPTAFEPLEASEEVFLDLALKGNSSTITWTPANGFRTGMFSSTNVEILGGTGASQFLDRSGPDGTAEAFIFHFSPTGWAFGGNIDVQLNTVPEPATLIFIATGLVSLIGYRLRRRMS